MMQRSKNENEDNLKYQSVMQIQRYKKSLIDEDLDHFIDSVYLDLNDENMIVMIVSDAWLNQSYPKRKEVERIMLEMWIRIHSPENSGVSTVRLITSDGIKL